MIISDGTVSKNDNDGLYVNNSKISVGYLNFIDHPTAYCSQFGRAVFKNCLITINRDIKGPVFGYIPLTVVEDCVINNNNDNSKQLCFGTSTSTKFVRIRNVHVTVNNFTESSKAFIANGYNSSNYQNYFKGSVIGLTIGSESNKGTDAYITPAVKQQDVSHDSGTGKLYIPAYANGWIDQSLA